MDRKKLALILLALVIAVIAIYFAYRELILKPMIEEQVKTMFGNYRAPGIQPPNFPE